MPTNPTRSILGCCCACAASGHAAAPPSSVMKSRRLMASLLGRGSHCFMGGSVDDRTRRQRPRDRAGVIHVARDFVQVGPHHAPEPCQGDRRLSVKQRSAKIPLQRADGGGQRGLRDAAAAGCAGEAELFAQRQEVTDLVHLHWFIASHSLSSASATHPLTRVRLRRPSLRLYAHVTSLELNPYCRRQIVLVPLKIFGDFVCSRSRGPFDHGFDDLMPEGSAAPYHGGCHRKLRDRHVHSASPPCCPFLRSTVPPFTGLSPWDKSELF